MARTDIDRTQFYTRSFCESLAVKVKGWAKNPEGDDELHCSVREDDHTPSCRINPRKGTYFDFGRGGSGKETFISELCKKRGVDDPFPKNGTGVAPTALRSQESIQRQAARELWERATEAEGHPYLLRKKVEANGTRRSKVGVLWKDGALKKMSGDFLLVPAYDSDGSLIGLEQVTGDGKKYALGSKGFHILDELNPDAPLILAEGFATAASIKALSGANAACCFGAAQFESSVRDLRKVFPGEIVVAPDAGTDVRIPGVAVVELPSGSEKNDDWNDMHAELGIEDARAFFNTAWDNRVAIEDVVAEAEDVRTEVPSRKFHFIDIDDLDVRPPQWLVKGFLEKDLLGSFFGASESGKSFIAVDLALSVASEAPFAGHSVVSPGLVCYIAGEGASGIKNRIGAWCMARGIPRRGIPFVLSSQSADMLDAESVQTIIEEAAAAAERHGVQLVLLILDTLSRNFGAGDENSSQDMKSFIDALDTIRLSFPGCSVLTVHHSGHADKSRARGSTVFRAAMDAEYLVEKDGLTIKLSNSKQKDAARQPDVFFEMEYVILGEEADGTPFGSAVLRKLDEAPQQMKKLTEIQQIALQAFRDAVDDFGQVDRLGRFQGVRVSDWQDVFCSMRDGRQDTKRRAFERASEALEERHYVKMENGMATFAGATAGVEATDAAKRILSRKECEDDSDADSDTRTIPDKTDLSGTCPKLSKPGLYDNLDRHGQGYEIPLSCPGVRPEDRDIKTAVVEANPKSSYLELLKGGERDADTKVS